MNKILRAWPELWITGTMLAIVAVLAIALGVPISLPQGDRAAFVGVHYLYPLLGVGVFGIFALFGQRRRLASTFFIALPCYAAILVLHFNIKLWRPLINPRNWDWLLWQTDQALSPLVSLCFALRRAISPIVGYDSNLYMVAFITMFYISFCFHALRSPDSFRRLFLGAIVFQSLGALAYLVLPALGPFIYQTGLEPMQSRAQQGMYGDYRLLVAGGRQWIAENGGTHLTVGLGAMPSLHTGGSFLFLLFAWRYARQLVPLYLLLVSFILIDSVASRWHYLVDVPVGLALALASARIAERLAARTEVGPVAGEQSVDDAVEPVPVV